MLRVAAGLLLHPIKKPKDTTEPLLQIKSSEHIASSIKISD